MALSQAVEDYLKTIYKLEQNDAASTKNIAEALHVSAASVTNMIKRLAKMGFVEYTSYRGVNLTDAGLNIALEIIRHHRLLELYLNKVMGYSWDEVHDEAEQLEHHISEQFEDRIAELLDDPTHDPHGDPIPRKNGQMPEYAVERLVEMDEGQTYVIGRVRNQDPEVLRYLEELGLIPGVKITIQEKAPFNGPITLVIEKNEQVIGYEVASMIFVTPWKESISE
jgi:DtxR family Mn-dependent transcriptional regulator